MHNHLIEALLLLGVAIHAAFHWREDVRAAWRWLKHALGIPKFSAACRSAKALMVIAMIAMTCIAASPFVYYGFECVSRLMPASI